MESNLTASDVALLNNDGFGGGNSFMWIFGLLILLGLFNGNGGFGTNNYDRPATQSDVQYTSQFGQLLDGNRDLATQANNNINSILGAINSSEYENIAVVKDAQLQLQDRLSAIAVTQANAIANQNECCCNTRLELANSTAAINANTTAQTQKILDAISRNKIEDLQAQVSALQLAQATSGMLKFPNAWTYAGGFFPPLMPPTTTTGGTTTTG